MVDRDRVKGAINEMAGRAKRQVGEWTGDTDAQIEGLAQEVKGKAQKTWGGVKDEVRAARDQMRRELAKRKTTHAGDGRGEDCGTGQAAKKE
jgi:uncharacterized protein YjbJ (UPF0337 family)